MREKTFEVSYVDIDPTDDAHDVSFELSEDAEDALFNAIADKVHDQASKGVFDGETVHLYKKLAEQQESHPPWFETEADRTYDLTLTDSEYSTLTTIIGKQLRNVLGPGGAERYRELLSVWESITDQMLHQQQMVEGYKQQNARLDDYSTVGDPENGEFRCFIHDGTVAVFENDDGDRWYRCTECDTTYAEIGDEHGCLHE